jgi:branched-chain amino acid transport system permease protein
MLDHTPSPRGCASGINRLIAGHLEFGGVRLEAEYGLIICVTLAAFGALKIFLDRTDAGRALTACSDNPRAARLVGIDVTRAGMAAFALGGALGGLAGALLTPIQPVSFNSDVGIAINGFAAAIFGNLVRPGAALVGGLLLGVAEALVGGFWSPGIQGSAALVIMLALLSWRAGRVEELLQDVA